MDGCELANTVVVADFEPGRLTLVLEILRIRADPLSPDQGQYSFVQGLLRTVAYEMLSRRERPT